MSCRTEKHGSEMTSGQKGAWNPDHFSALSGPHGALLGRVPIRGEAGLSPNGPRGCHLLGNSQNTRVLATLAATAAGDREPT